MFNYPNFINRLLKRSDWKQEEYFDPIWKKRILAMSKYIPDGASVIDLGCGKMWLSQVKKLHKYYPVDYKSRGPETIVCDFNLKEFPEIEADCSFVSGCLEYVTDYEWFIKQLSKHTKRCILSYCTTDKVPNIITRAGANWKNNLSQKKIINSFELNNYKLVKIDDQIKDNPIFVFDK